METSTIHLATWRGRYEALSARLELEPQHPLVWHRRLEAKVLRFLLSRYGEAPSAPLPVGSGLWMSWLAFATLPGEARFAARDHLKTLRRIARANAEARASSKKLRSFFQNFAPTGSFWLEQERQTIEHCAIQRERERAL